jgi:hypothetical protein
MWRTVPLVPDITVPHYPETCAACNHELSINDNAKPHMGYYVLELEKQNSGIQVNCQLHHYYGAVCNCGHYTKTAPYSQFINPLSSAIARTGAYIYSNVLSLRHRFNHSLVGVQQSF